MLTLKNVYAAREVLSSCLPVSPLLPYLGLKPAGSPEVLLKAECLMPTGSFKIRGATYKLACLSGAEKAAGVMAYSTGNHAQAVAKAARDQGIRATIVMSPDAPPAKLAATRAWGAEIVMAEPSSQARRALAEALAAQQGMTLVPPYDDAHVMAGQGTIGLELLRQMSANGAGPAAVFVPIGGGGLIAGIAKVLKSIRPDIVVIGVEPVLEDDARRSLVSGRIEENSGPSHSCADAVRVASLGRLTFPVIQRYVDAIVTATEEDITQAVSDCYAFHRLVVEPAGALALAAALRHARHYPGNRPVVALLSGGNIDLKTLMDLCAGQ